jgi:hypothetical protein
MNRNTSKRVRSYKLNNRCSIPEMRLDYSPRHKANTGSGAHPMSYPQDPDRIWGTSHVLSTGPRQDLGHIPCLTHRTQTGSGAHPMSYPQDPDRIWGTSHVLSTEPRLDLGHIPCLIHRTQTGSGAHPMSYPPDPDRLWGKSHVLSTGLGTHSHRLKRLQNEADH